MKVAVKVAAAGATLGLVALAVAALRGDEGDEHSGRPAAACPSFADRRDHRADPPRDAVIGRVGWYALPSAFERPRRAPRAGVRAIEAPTIVRAGAPVTVVVPKRQRSWMWLDYTGHRTHAVELRPCPEGLTHWNGRVVVDHGRAPNRGRCARLAVRARGEARPRRGFAFAPPRGFCGARARDVVLGSPDYVRSHGEGWGSPRPARVSNGGSPGGVIAGIRWDRWGGRHARGRGTAYRIGPDGYVPRPARLHATSAGRCDGYAPRAYRVLRVRITRLDGRAGAWHRWNRSSSLCA